MSKDHGYTSPTLCLCLCLFCMAYASQQDNLAWIRGVNYVPSWSRNDIHTLEDYNASVVEEELAHAAFNGFNAVRLFLH